MTSPILASGLVRTFGTGDNEVRAVDGVDLAGNAGEIFGFLGIFWAIALANLIAGLAAAAWFRHLFDRLATAR